MREKVPKVIAELRYVPKAQARARSIRSTRRINE